MSKPILDPNNYSGGIGGLDLLGHTIRKSVEYNKNAGRTVYPAIVIWEPVEVFANENTTHIKFKAEIIADSPAELAPGHAFLEQACDITTLQGCTEDMIAIISQYTTVVGYIEPGNDAPKVGDTVLIRLKTGDHGLDYSQAEYQELVSKNSSKDPNAGTFFKRKICLKIAEIFKRKVESGEPVVTPEVVAPPAGAYTLQAALMHLEKQTPMPAPPGFNSATGTAWYEYVYATLFAALSDKNLVLGIMANAIAESTFNPLIVSTSPGESSLGLWQCNVGKPPTSGRWGAPRNSMGTNFDKQKLPAAIKLSSSAQVPYFAGILLATNKGVSTISPEEFAENQDWERVGKIYKAVANGVNQVEFVIDAANKMLSTLTYEADDITAPQWAQWWQIYFEQPAAIHDRGQYVARVQSTMSTAGIIV